MCVGVPDSCEGYGYSQTLLPNKFGHNSTADVSLMLDSLNPLKVNLFVFLELVIVVRLFLTMQQVFLLFVIVVFPTILTYYF